MTSRVAYGRHLPLPLKAGVVHSVSYVTHARSRVLKDERIAEVDLSGHSCDPGALRLWSYDLTEQSVSYVTHCVGIRSPKERGDSSPAAVQ